MNNALFVLGLAVLAFAAGPATTPLGAMPRLDGTNWALSTLAGQTPAGRTRITLGFDAGRIRGTDGCNQYSGPYSADDTRLEIGPELMSTQMGCPAQIMQLAGSYMSGLMAVRGYRLTGGELQLFGSTGEVLATFAIPLQALAGTWWVTGINNHRQALASVLPGAKPTVEFSPTGAISGFGGCNRYSATYTLLHDTISVTAPASTRMRCTHPAGVMEQELDLLQALQTVTEFRQQANRLELRRADGALAVSLAKD